MIFRIWPEFSAVSLMSLRFIALIVSVIALLASAAFLTTRGLNLGIDFAGGAVLEIDKPEDVSADQIRNRVTELVTGDVQVNSARGTGANAPEIAVIRFEPQPPVGDETPDEAQNRAGDVVSAAMRELIGEERFNLRSEASVGPKVSGELFRSGIIALTVALTLMMIYISFRFQWQYALGAVAALFHDVILTMGMFALTGFEFNLATIAALLTIVGYSMNDTVIVFDRVREEARKYKKLELAKVVDLAINATMSRTLLTSSTTLLALLSIFLFGGPVLRGMSFALIFGVIVGTYSSIFVASAVVLLLGIDRGDKPKREVEGFQGVS
ncbi:MAG: protein translocase subunit SecF [Hyphomonas sp.]|nr:protein translocase subunit SecF [Hyphomonas sp.]